MEGKKDMALVIALLFIYPAWPLVDSALLVMPVHLEASLCGCTSQTQRRGPVPKQGLKSMWSETPWNRNL